MSENGNGDAKEAPNTPVAEAPKNGVHPESKAEAAPTQAEAATTPDDAPRADRPPDAPAEEEGMSFAEMFELAEKQAKEKKQTKVGLRPGQIIEARIVSMSHDSAFLDVGSKAEGVIPRAELLDDEGELKVKEGDRVEVRVRSVDGSSIALTKVLPHQSMRIREQIQAIKDGNQTVEGRVQKEIKGGFEVSVLGMRAFCPQSQIDFRYAGNADQYLNQKFPFRISEFKDNGRNIVVSRRAILMEERKQKGEALLATIDVGSQLNGTVVSLKDYGAFVDLGGIEGLVHASEIAHGHVRKPSDVLKAGQEVKVQILKIEERPGADKKISLSMKALEDDPWDRAKASLAVGDKAKGKVVRIQPFGAFVELLPGVDGLIHVSNMSLDKKIAHPKEVLKPNDEVEATITSIDWDKQRIGLSLVKTPQELARELSVGNVEDAEVERIESFGLFVKLASGARGLVPAAETGTQRGSDLSQSFSVGKTIKVTLLDKDKKSGKLRFSIRRVEEAEERAEYKGYLKKQQGSGFGTLGDLLKNKFGDSLPNEKQD